MAAACVTNQTGALIFCVLLFVCKGLIKTRRTGMGQQITVAELKAALGRDIDVLLDEVVSAVNQAEPGRIIADSEERVRDAAAVFRQRLYQMVLALRQNKDAGDFSPSG